MSRPLCSPFALFNIIQFLAAINENLYKLLAAYFLIYELGVGKTDTIMAIVGGLFILPFLLFSSLGGIFADKWPKNRIVIGTRFLEFICLLVALVFFKDNFFYGAYIVLFFMASFSAIFGPSKYGLIPELTPPSKILYANSIIAFFTYLGIIFGTALPSVVIWMTGSNYVMALFSSLGLAFIGLILSLYLPKTPIGNKTKSFRFFIYIELWETIKQMWKIPFLFSASFAYCYFLFIGGFVQLNLIPYTMEILKFSDIVGGYLFLITALGLGIGAFFTNRISKGKIRLSLIPLSGIGISIVLMALKWLFIPWYLVALWLIILGFLGGIFIVSPQAFILAKSPEKTRGRNFATVNFFSFAFALLSSFALYLLNTTLKISPASSFFVIGIINLIVMFLFIWTSNIRAKY